MWRNKLQCNVQRGVWFVFNKKKPFFWCVIVMRPECRAQLGNTEFMLCVFFFLFHNLAFEYLPGCVKKVCWPRVKHVDCVWTFFGVPTLPLHNTALTLRHKGRSSLVGFCGQHLLVAWCRKVPYQPCTINYPKNSLHLQKQHILPGSSLTGQRHVFCTSVA